MRQHSTATGVMDTSITSMRRSTASNYNRASLHINNNRCGNAEGGSGTCFQRQASMQLHHSVALQNNGAGGGSGVGAACDKR